VTSRRFSQAIAEGEGISLIGDVKDAAGAARAEQGGADAVLISPADVDNVDAIRAATALPIVANWPGNPPPDLSGVDACVLAVDAEPEWLERVYAQVRGELDVAFWIEDEEHLESALEEFDPEIFVLAAPDADGEEALERLLDLLPEVPAGKLAIAELPESSRDDVGALERAGFDGVIVEPERVAELVGDEPPEV
jgi:hypothetical protein